MFMVSISSINSAIETGYGNLAVLTERHELEKIRDLAVEQFALCKKEIGLAKGLPKFKEQQKAWKKARWQAFKLKSDAEEKLKLITKREALYAASALPTTPTFPSLLEKIESKHPKLKEDLVHFQSILQSCMRVTPESLRKEDLVRLQKIQALLIETADPELNELNQAVRRLIQTTEQAISEKKILLEDLEKHFAALNLASESYASWGDKEKIELLVRAQQILFNPFDPHIDPQLVLDPSKPFHTLLLKLLAEDTTTRSKKDFWDNKPELERKAHRLAKEKSLHEWLVSCKFEGIKAYIKLRKDYPQEEQALIIGAGPAGLIRAICLTLKGKQPLVIEKRAQDKTPRMNTVTLGKWEPKELDVLAFLGTLDLMHEKISYGHNRPFYTESAIGHLEQALEETWNRIDKDHLPIRYNTSVQGIRRRDTGEAELTLVNSTTQEKQTRSGGIVFIADGASGGTKELLGINSIKLAKPTLLAFSIFKDSNVKKPSPLEALRYRVKYGVKGVLFSLKWIAYALLRFKSLEEAYSNTAPAGPSGLSRVPTHDYLLRIFRHKEQQKIEKKRAEIRKLSLKIQFHQGGAKEERLKKRKEILEKQLMQHLEQKASKVYGFLDFVHSCFNPRGHRMRKSPMEHQQTFLVDVMVSRAEEPAVQMGNTLFLLRGDACHTTDPYSGTGCKTAIEEMLADQYFLGIEKPSQASELERSILNFGQDYYQQKMINKAFEERFFYYKGTELPIRFADLAQKEGILTAQEAREFSRSIKAQNKTVTESIHSKLHKALLKHLQEQKIDLDHFKWKGPPKLTILEMQRLKKLLKVAAKAHSIDGLNKLKASSQLFAKLTFAGAKEGWLLALLFENAARAQG